jgi:hypothetical protein
MTSSSESITLLIAYSGSYDMLISRAIAAYPSEAAARAAQQDLIDLSDAQARA